LRGTNSLNWGGALFHYTTPEGSYATDPEGTARISEFRAMVKSLHDMGFSVVMDVVYNHTNASGNSENSVLDKIVPGYYHRLNPDSGAVEKSTCCDNTATEAIMFQKLMVDSLVVWARDYQIDAFRFDLMGHHPRQGIIDALAAIRAVRSHVYFYGEGWNFGEVANNAKFEQATQLNMAGTRVGTFSDRLRDAVRGGGPFDSGNALRTNQGFANGLFSLPNELSDADDATKDKLLALTDLIRVGMAANLEDFVLISRTGAPVFGKQLDYNGQPAGYAKEPADIINYVSKHDNQTLWDNNQYKIANGTTTASRVRMQLVGLAVPLMSQGIPFLHMGSDILRSKSMERDSFDSGDWFNKVDFSYMSNNWNVGLPREDKDGNNWPVISGVIADPEAAVTTTDISFANAAFRDLLSVRSSSKLFRLATGEDVKARVDFRNTGPDQIPGLIAMSIDDGIGLADLDPNNDAIVVIINASADQQTVTIAGASGFTLNAIQATGADSEVMSSFANDDQFTVPALSTAIFVKSQGAVQGNGLPVTAKDLTAIPPYGGTRVFVRGSMNGFGTNDEMTFAGSGVYEATIYLTAGSYSFKVAEANWSNPNLGADQSVTLGVPLLLVPGGGSDIGLTLEADSVVQFSLNASDPSLPSITVTAGAS
jgi:pullulanase